MRRSLRCFQAVCIVEESMLRAIFAVRNRLSGRKLMMQCDLETARNGTENGLKSRRETVIYGAEPALVIRARGFAAPKDVSPRFSHWLDLQAKKFVCWFRLSVRLGLCGHAPMLDASCDVRPW